MTAPPAVPLAHETGDPRCPCRECGRDREQQVEAAARQQDRRRHLRLTDHEEEGASAGYDWAAIRAMLPEGREDELVFLLSRLQAAVGGFWRDREAVAACRDRFSEIEQRVAAADEPRGRWQAWLNRRERLAAFLELVVAQANASSEHDSYVAMMTSVREPDMLDAVEEMRIIESLPRRSQELGRRRAQAPRDDDEPWTAAERDSFRRARARANAEFEHNVRRTLT